MEKLQICGPRLLWLCGLAIVVTACDNRSNPASPSALEPLGNRVTVCHRTNGGTYLKLDVSASAVAGHMGHGDMMPNSDGNCVVASSPPPPPPPPDPLPLTLACGAPAVAAHPGEMHPGSTVFPGPTVDASAGVYLDFLVTASPAPASGTNILREIRDTRSTGETVMTSNHLLSAAGSYQGFIFLSGEGSFLREIRFTLDGTSCSLFWSINQ